MNTEDVNCTIGKDWCIGTTNSLATEEENSVCSNTRTTSVFWNKSCSNNTRIAVFSRRTSRFESNTSFDTDISVDTIMWSKVDLWVIEFPIQTLSCLCCLRSKSKSRTNIGSTEYVEVCSFWWIHSGSLDCRTREGKNSSSNFDKSDTLGSSTREVCGSNSNFAEGDRFVFGCTSKGEKNCIFWSLSNKLLWRSCSDKVEENSVAIGGDKSFLCSTRRNNSTRTIPLRNPHGLRQWSGLFKLICTVRYSCYRVSSSIDESKVIVTLVNILISKSSVIWE